MLQFNASLKPRQERWGRESTCDHSLSKWPRAEAAEAKTLYDELSWRAKVILCNKKKRATDPDYKAVPGMTYSTRPENRKKKQCRRSGVVVIEPCLRRVYSAPGAWAKPSQLTSNSRERLPKDRAFWNDSDSQGPVNPKLPTI